MRKAIIIILLLLHLQCAYSQNAHYDSLKKLISSTENDSIKFSKTAEMIWSYLYSNPDSAALYIQQNILLAQKMKSDDELSFAYTQYSTLEQLNGNYSDALQYQLQSLRVTERTNDSISICEAYFGLGDIYREAGDFEKSIYYLRKAKFLLDLILKPASFEQEKNWRAVSRYIYCLLLSAQTFDTFNQPDSALKYANNVHDLYLKGPGNWGTSEDTLFFSRNLAPIMGNIYSKTGDYSTALKYYRSGVAMASIDDVKKDLMDNYSGAAITFKKMGQLDSSIVYAIKVLELSKVARNISVKLNALNLLSDVYKIKHNADSVAKYLELTIETKDSLFNQQKVMQVQNISFNEQLREQEIKDQQEKYQSRLRTYFLTGGLLVVLLLAGILYRNNLQKQKAKIKIEKAYEELKTTQAQLIQSEKMASLGQLTAGIAHEIQNPLNFVNNFSEVNKELIEELQEERKKETRDFSNENNILNDIKENEQKINHHGKRADAIVKGMLQHRQIGSGIKEPTDINVLADEYLRLSYHGIRAKDKSFNVTLQTNFDETIGKINIIPQDIGRVLFNLYNNAFYALSAKASDFARASSVKSASADGKHEPTVWVSTKMIGNKVLISVRDNGPGIPQNIVDKIFQPFFTTKPTGQGTGLGLSLAYDIVKAHGGEIKVETLSADKAGKEGEGAEFTIILPIV